jgi:hypothetical protein
MRFAETETPGIARLREPVDMRTARIRESHNFGAFVESLSGGIINGLAEYLHLISALHKHNL